jgi:hypothetical protein
MHHPILPRRLSKRDVHNKRPPGGGLASGWKSGKSWQGCIHFFNPKDPARTTALGLGATENIESADGLSEIRRLLHRLLLLPVDNHQAG